jgi:hypothetical protein
MGATLGPNAVVAIDVGGEDNGPLHDLMTATVFNAPTENWLEILRNENGGFMPLVEMELEGRVNHANAIVLRADAKPVVAALIEREQGATFRAVDVSSGEVVEVLQISDLPRGGNYVVGRFGPSPLATLVFYSTGERTLTVRSLTESGGRYQPEPARQFELDGTIRILAVLGEGQNARLMAIFGGGRRASIMPWTPSPGRG